MHDRVTDDVRTAMRSVWAKSDQQPSSDSFGSWMPLHQHLDDTAAVAARLWDRWVPRTVRQVVSACLDGDDARAKRLLVWLASVHDVGKASPAFAVQFRDGAARMAAAGLTTSVVVADQARRQARHELVGQLRLTAWLCDRYGWDQRDADRVGVVVGGHHGTAPTKGQLATGRNLPDQVGTGLWMEVQDAFYDRQSRHLQEGDLATPLPLTRTAQVLLTSLVIVADWIASNSDLFSYAGGDPDARADRAWARLDLPAPWRASSGSTDADELLAARFARSGGARPVQRAAVRLAATMDEPGLIVIEAPMGEGKTEAALLAAEVLAARSGAGGCFVALPTQATTDAMFDRVLSWMARLPDGGRLSTFLAHGKASLNDTYRGLFSGARLPSSIAVDDDGGRAAHEAVSVVVHQWLSGRKKGVLSSFVVGTVDQTLFLALKSKHLVLRHLALAGKVVIIDEVHAYDVYMGSYLRQALHWLGAYRVPVVLLSATLPAARRDQLVAAYRAGRELPPAPEGEVGSYPVLTATGREVVQLSCAPSGRTLQVQVEALPCGDDELSALGDRLAVELADGGCALVVRNTVRRAQEAARELSDRFGAEHVTVAHARFLAGQRAAKDLALLRAFGPPGPDVDRPPMHVVVATQVVEQSLDVDFDLLVTDAAPVDLVLQRMGRLHRHDRGAARPTRLRVPRCLLTGVDLDATPPVFDRGSETVYQREALLRAMAVLLPHLAGQAVSLPEHIQPLVQRAYGGGEVGPAEWQDEMSAAGRKARAAARTRQEAAEVFQLRDAPGTAPILGWVDAGAGALSDESPAAQAHVRDGDPSLEVLVVVRTPDGLALPPSLPRVGGRLLPVAQPIEAAEARALASSALRLPASMTKHPAQLDAVIDELEREHVMAWEAHPLTAGQLVLVLDDDGTRELAGRSLRCMEQCGREEVRA